MNWVKKIGFYTAFIVPAATVIGFYLGGFWNLLTIVLVFIAIPLADYCIGEDPENLSEDESLKIAEAYYYRLITFIWTFFQFGFLIWGAYVVASYPLQWWEFAFFSFSFALVTGGIGITVAHELGHKKSKLEQFYAKVLLMTVSYMHFMIEHNKGHHVHVATPKDPATGRKNENFYRFWSRSVMGSYRSAWKLEEQRLNRKNIPFWSWKNNMIIYSCLPFVFCAVLVALAYVIGLAHFWLIIPFFFSQSIVAFSLLEIVNYIEHYGIVRKEIAPGRYERVNPMHSWNSNHRLSNYFLFQLQRHSDHHANAFKRYQVLKHYNESPQLPSGYPAMILLASFPPLWFKLMNPKLKAWENAVYSKR